MRGLLRVVVDAVRHGLAPANVRGDVFNVGHGAGPRGHDHVGDFDTKPATRLELIGGRENVDLIFGDLTGPDRRGGTARELLERLAELRSRRSIARYGEEPSRVAGFDRAKPERNIRGLRGHDVGHVRTLQVLVVQ
jgi:hypothetical protein